MHEDVELVRADLQGILYRSPRLYDLSRSRWTLPLLRQVVPWLQQCGQQKQPISLPGLSKLLTRLRISYKRGQQSVHSPDLEYDKKLLLIRQARHHCEEDPEHAVLLYEDEHTYYWRPRVAKGYGPRGTAAPRARGTSSQTRRIAGCLNVATGAVIARQRNHFDLKEMYRFLWFVERTIKKQFPQVRRIYIALDNWPVHFHPKVLAELEKRHSCIQLLSLPTYAPWTNPMEKVWRKLCQEVLDLHEFGKDWDGLKKAISEWFDDLRDGSTDLLRYVGLAPPADHERDALALWCPAWLSALEALPH